MTLSIFLLPVIIKIIWCVTVVWKRAEYCDKKIASDYHESGSVSCLRTPHVCDFKWQQGESLTLLLDLFFDKRRKTWTSLSCWLVWVHLWNYHQSMLWDRIYLVPGIDILEMRLKLSQKLDFRTSNCTKWSERNRRNMLLLATVLFIVTYTKLWNLNLTAYCFYPRVIRYFCWKADSKIANKNMFHTPDRWLSVITFLRHLHLSTQRGSLTWPRSVK